MRRYGFKKIATLALVVLTLSTFGGANSVMAKDIMISGADYGYGKYVISAKAIGYDGVYDEESVVFYHLPVDAVCEPSSTADEYGVRVISAGEDVSSVDAYLGDQYLGSLSRDQFKSGEISFSMAGKPSGTYTITVVAKDAEGNMIYIPLTLTIDYTAPVIPDAGAPDTGGLFRNLNISREDYLATGLIVFFVLGILALLMVVSGKQKSRKRHQKRTSRKKA